MLSQVLGVLAVLGVIAGLWLLNRWLDNPDAQTTEASDVPGSLLRALKHTAEAAKRGLSGTVYGAESPGATQYVADHSPRPGTFAARAHIEAGQRALQHGNVQAALTSFHAAAAVDPPSWEAQRWLAEAFRILNQPSAALHHAHEAFARYPSSFEVTRQVVATAHAAGEGAADEIAQLRHLWSLFFAKHVPGRAAACVDEISVFARSARVYFELDAGPDLPFAALVPRGFGGVSAPFEGYLLFESAPGAPFGSPLWVYYATQQGRVAIAPACVHPSPANYPALRQQLLTILHTLPAHPPINEPGAGRAPAWAPSGLSLEGASSPLAVLVSSQSPTAPWPYVPPTPTGAAQAAWPAPPTASPVQPPMHVWGTAVAPKPLFVGGFKEAIFQGAGLLNPRLSGLGYMAAGALCAGGTYLLVNVLGVVFIYPAALATGLGLPGLFMVVTGEPKARPGDESQPVLVRVGLMLSFMVGSIGGLFLLGLYV